MSKPIKIALVDDEVLFLEGLSLLLSTYREEIEIVVSATGASDLLHKLHILPPENLPELILLDIQMKPIDGFELVEKIKNSYAEMRIIVLSSHYKQAMFGHMISLGVAAFLPKNASQNMLLEAIQKVHRNGVFFTAKDQEMLTDFVKNNSPKRYFNSTEQLSAREVEVLQLICAEYTNQEIAEKLFLSKRTVESHRQRLLEKTGAKNTAGLVIYAVAHGFHRPDSRYYF